MAVKAVASITGCTAAVNQTSQHANLAAQNVQLAVDQFGEALKNWESYVLGLHVSTRYERVVSVCWAFPLLGGGSLCPCKRQGLSISTMHLLRHCLLDSDIWCAGVVHTSCGQTIPVRTGADCDHAQQRLACAGGLHRYQGRSPRKRAERRCSWSGGVIVVVAAASHDYAGRHAGDSWRYSCGHGVGHSTGDQRKRFIERPNSRESRMRN